MSAAAAPRPGFRPDLEGLRGLAILLVVLYHAGVPGLAGGFVGVDVFFVLSGYLITGGLAREAAATGGVDLGAFWSRRALRLLPALFLVLLATLGLAWAFYAPIDRAAVADAARAAALSSSNVAFAADGMDYFGGGARSPLLHTWSLGVEQQFYLVWPLVVLALALAAGRGGAALGGAASGGVPFGAPDARLRRALVAGSLVAGALSLGFGAWQTGAAPPWAFYGVAARLWEFALGGALAAWLAGDAGKDAVAGARGAWLQGAGLAAVAAAVLAYDAGTPYPGVAALVPAFGAAAVVAGGAAGATGVAGRLLAAGGLRWLGRVSYAWYLWHWPLVALGAVLHPGIGAPGRLAWSLLALGLAWLTERVVERSVEGSARDGRLARLPAEWLPAATLAATAVVALSAHLAGRAAERRARRPDQRAFLAARADRAGDGCWERNVAGPPSPRCVFGDARAATTVVLLGDSHAQHWLAALDRLGRERGWRVVPMVKGGCPVAAAPELEAGRGGARARACARYREAALRQILQLRPAAAVLSSWDGYVPVTGAPAHWQVTPEAWERGLRRTYARLSAAGVPVVALRDVPNPGVDVPACLSRRAAGLPFAGDCTYALAEARSPRVAAAQARAARGLRVRVVDPADLACAAPAAGGSRCAPARGGVVVFSDDDHLTAGFARLAAPAFGARVAAAAAALGVRLP